jgi:hypothetical protein
LAGNPKSFGVRSFGKANVELFREGMNPAGYSILCDNKFEILAGRVAVASGEGDFVEDVFNESWWTI